METVRTVKNVLKDKINLMRKALEEDLEGLPITVDATPTYAYLEIPARYVKRLVYELGWLGFEVKTDEGDTVDIEISRDHGLTVGPLTRGSSIKAVDRDGRVRPSTITIEYVEDTFRIILPP